MDPGPSPERRERLRALARSAVAHAVKTGEALPVDPAQYEPALREPRAVFVTLRRLGELRGCTGTLEAAEPLVVAVARSAWRTALHDPRFEPVAEAELAELDLHLSILNPPEPLPVSSEVELLAALRRGVDGLILEQGPHRATFLPAVWESLPEPRDFVAELKRKAGLRSDYWSPEVRVQRYTVEDV